LLKQSGRFLELTAARADHGASPGWLAARPNPDHEVSREAPRASRRERPPRRRLSRRPGDRPSMTSASMPIPASTSTRRQHTTYRGRVRSGLRLRSERQRLRRSRARQTGPQIIISRSEFLDRAAPDQAPGPDALWLRAQPPPFRQSDAFARPLTPPHRQPHLWPRRQMAFAIPTPGRTPGQAVAGASSGPRAGPGMGSADVVVDVWWRVPAIFPSMQFRQLGVRRFEQRDVEYGHGGHTGSDCRE
jgi:hypothetical protein